MQKIVFMLGSYYPNCSAVGRCMGNLADVLEKEYDVSVISMITHTTDSLEDVHGKQKVFRIKTRDMYGDMYCREQLKNGKKRYVIAHRVYQIKRVLKAVLSKNSVDAELVRAYKKALDELEDVPVAIIPACQPFESIVAALEYRMEHVNCKVIPVLYDMFAASGRVQRFSWNQKIKMPKNQLLEKRMMEECERVLHMPSWSPYIDEYFSEYKAKCVEVEHPLLVRPEGQKNMEYEDGYYHIVYTGVVDVKIRNPLYALEFFKDLDASQKVKVHFYSLGSAEQIVESMAKTSKNIIAHGQVSGQEAHAAMNSANMLLSIGNSNIAQMPSKPFEYMSTGKPIVHFYYNEDDPVLKLLERYPLACCLPINLGKVEEQKEVLVKFIEQCGETKIDFEEVACLFQTANASQTAELLLSLIIDEKPTFIFGGGLSKHYVEADYLLKLLAYTPIASMVAIKFFSAGNACDILEKTELDIKNYGWVAHDVLMEQLESASFLVSIAEKSGRQISSKIFEYMSIGKPILHIYYVDTDVNLKYLQQYPLGLCLKAVDDELQQNQEKLYKWLLDNYGLHVPFEDVIKYCREMTPEYIAEYLKMII